MSALFREQAVKAQGERLLGDVVISQPLALRILVFLLLAIVVAIGVIGANATYARKETVTGYVSPVQGIVRVSASQSGVISSLLVGEGDNVEAGTPLVIIQSDRANENGMHRTPEMIRSVDDQLRELDELERIVAKRNKQKKQQLGFQLESLSAEERVLKTRINSQHRSIEIASDHLSRVRSLAADGYVTAQGVVAKEEELIAATQVLTALDQELIGIGRETEELRGVLDQLPLELDERKSELRTRRADLRLQRLQLSTQGPTTILAPVEGTVSAASVVVGDSITHQQHLMTLLPAGSSLEAHLYVPTRAIGFVSKGQEVRLLYDAFDYRKYGVQIGQVHEVSSAIVPANQTFERVMRNEPSYKVRVALSEQTFRTKGETFTLQPGMTLRADIILEHRTLLSWMANPILALRGRT